MRIGVDARSLASVHYAGISYCFLNTIKSIEKIDQSSDFFLYSNVDFILPFNNSRWKKRIGQGPFTSIGSVWMCTQGNQMLLEDKIDVFWAPWPILPFYLPFKKAVTVYDFVWQLYPQTMFFLYWVLFNTMAQASITRADAVFAISKSTLNDVVKSAKNKNNLYLTYLGVDSTFKPLDQGESASYISHKYNCSKQYMLNVGTIEPRKNIINLLRSFGILKEKYKIPHQLLIAGGKGWRESKIYHEYDQLKCKDAVVFLGYVSDEDMPKLYSGAEVFIYPSFYEGFGLPPLEAMACGCPTIVSQTSSLPEVVGDCGLLIDPNDPVEIADKVYELLSSENLKIQCRLKGLERAKMFSWEKTAKIVLEVLLRLPLEKKVVIKQ